MKQLAILMAFLLAVMLLITSVMAVGNARQSEQMVARGRQLSAARTDLRKAKKENTALTAALEKSRDANRHLQAERQAVMQRLKSALALTEEDPADGAGQATGGKGSSELWAGLPEGMGVQGEVLLCARALELRLMRVRSAEPERAAGALAAATGGTQGGAEPICWAMEVGEAGEAGLAAGAAVGAAGGDGAADGAAAGTAGGDGAADGAAVGAAGGTALRGLGEGGTLSLPGGQTAPSEEGALAGEMPGAEGTAAEVGLAEGTALQGLGEGGTLSLPGGQTAPSEEGALAGEMPGAEGTAAEVGLAGGTALQGLGEGGTLSLPGGQTAPSEEGALAGDAAVLAVSEVIQVPVAGDRRAIITAAVREAVTVGWQMAGEREQRETPAAGQQEGAEDGPREAVAVGRLEAAEEAEQAAIPAECVLRLLREQTGRILRFLEDLCAMLQWAVGQ
ncbi:MAG: hypothetical protein E7320_10680 [Clostridiales bacterium]|nr:hypothetical protein [Clostridiales bacterium]